MKQVIKKRKDKLSLFKGRNMRTLNIGFDIEKTAPNDASKQWLKEEGYSGAFTNLLNQGISGQFPQGVPLSKAKILSRIQDKLKAMESDDQTLDIEEAEYDLLKSVFMNDSTPFLIGQVGLATIFSEAVEKAEKHKPVELKAVE